MPRYFFDTRDAGTVVKDAVGTELPDDGTARRHVGRILPDLARRGLPDGEAHIFGCTARSEAGAVVYSAELTYRGEKVPNPS